MFKPSISFLLSLLVATIFISTGCNKFNPEEQALWDEVMKLHDDSMLNHGVMMQNTSQIRKAIKEGKAPGQLEIAVKPILEKIDAADEAMMSWMSDLKGPVKLSGKSHKEIMTYLTAEKGKIEVIDKNILEQLTISRNILNVIETPKPPQE